MTQSTSSPDPKASVKRTPVAADQFADECGIGDWSAFVQEVQRVRRHLGAPTTRWAGPCLATALQLAVKTRGWPAEHAPRALRRVAADPKTRSPMRVAEAGPWWDEEPDPTRSHDLPAMETALLEAGGVRIELQTRARRELETAGLPVTREAVVRRAYRLLTEPGDSPGAA